jgi:hypothetical protein
MLTFFSLSQSKIGRKVFNWPCTGIVPVKGSSTTLAPIPDYLNPKLSIKINSNTATSIPYPTFGVEQNVGNTSSYAWWITAFEFAGLVLSALAVLRFPELKIGMVGFLAVLTAACFVYTGDIYNDKYGVWALTHSIDQTSQIPTKLGMGGLAGAFAFFNSQAAMFAGLLIVNVANPLLMLTISAEEPVVVEEEEKIEAQL